MNVRKFAGYVIAMLFLSVCLGAPGAAAAARIDLTGLHALNINADDFAAHIELANLLETTSGPSTALPVLERALLIQPFDVALHEKMAGIFTHTQQWDAAARSYRAIAALSPKDPLAIGFQLARTLHLAGDKHTARQQVLSVLERAPLYRDALELLLDIRDDKGLRKTPEQ